MLEDIDFACLLRRNDQDEYEGEILQGSNVLLYKEGSGKDPLSWRDNLFVKHIGVGLGFASIIFVFRRRSVAYFV